MNFEEVGELQCTYLDCTFYDGLAVLDNEAEVRVMAREQHRLCANAASDINNQRAFGELSPGVPCQFDVSKVRGWSAKIAK